MAPSPQVVAAVTPYMSSMDLSSRTIVKSLEKTVEDDEVVRVAGMTRWISRGGGESSKYGYYFITQRGLHFPFTSGGRFEGDAVVTHDLIAAYQVKPAPDCETDVELQTATSEGLAGFLWIALSPKFGSQFRINQHSWELPSQELARGILLGLGFEPSASDFTDPFGYQRY